MTDEPKPPTPEAIKEHIESLDPERVKFLSACAQVLGHVYATPGNDRALALAAIGAICAKTPPDAPLDQALRSFVIAVQPLVGAPDIKTAFERLDPADLRPIKRKAVENALQHGPAIIVLDTTKPNVEVPSFLAGVQDLKFRLGYELTPPIPDLKLDEAGVSCTLSFRGAPYKVFVPWDAVWGVGSEITHEGMTWPTCAPAGFNPTTGERPPDATMPRMPGERPKLGVIEGGLAEVVEDAAARFDARPIERASIEARAELCEHQYEACPCHPLESPAINAVHNSDTAPRGEEDRSASAAPASTICDCPHGDANEPWENHDTGCPARRHARSKPATLVNAKGYCGADDPPASSGLTESELRELEDLENALNECVACDRPAAFECDNTTSRTCRVHKESCCRPITNAIENIVTYCPKCGQLHIDEGEWRDRPHRTHLCSGCGTEWRPSEKYTRGVEPVRPTTVGVEDRV